MSGQEFYLSAFDSSFNVTLATMEQGTVSIPDFSASFVVNIPLADVKKLFQYDSSGSVENINDISAQDLKYYVDDNMLPSGSALASMKYGLTTEYIQYLAIQLFNTSRGVDLFNNERDLSSNILSNLDTVWSNVTSVVGAAADASPLTNDDTTSANLVRQLLLQMVYSQKSRFQSIVADVATDHFPIPFEVDDKISFVLTVHSDPTQTIIIGADPAGPVDPRTYKISLLVV